MENASKALLIAGEMLIAMLVASLMALLFSTMSSYADEHAQQRKIQEVQAFNASITQYAKVENCTAQDIVSLANFAKQMNEQMGCTGGLEIGHSNDHINIKVENQSNNMEIYGDNSLKTFLQNNSGYLNPENKTGFKYYTAKIEEYFEDGRIRVVYFEEQ